MMQQRLGAAAALASVALLAAPPCPAAAPPPTQQQAIVLNGGAGPQTLQLQTIPVPAPGSDQVLVRVVTASVNPADWAQLQRTEEGPAGAREVPGLDVSGVIAAVGAGVTRPRVGTAVFGMVEHMGLNGGYAQYALADAASVTEKPADISFAEAAGLGVAGVTALRALDEAQVQAGQRVLITGIAGGVGSIAAQAALARRAVVLGTASPRHDAYLHTLGVQDVIDYHLGDIAARAGKLDVVIDTVGGNEALQAFRALKPGGHFVSIARAHVPPQQCVAAQVQCFGSPGPAAHAPVAVLEQVAQLARDGKLHVHVDHTYPLAQAAQALQYVHDGHTEGKVVLAVGHP